jgi:hypothetical protein
MKKNKDSDIYSGALLQTGVKNKNGRIYPLSVFEKAVVEYEKKIADGRAIGELGHPDSFEINLSRVSHEVVSVKRKFPKAPRKLKKKLKKLGIWEPSVYVANYRLLGTEMGIKTLDIMGTLAPSPRGSGSVDPNGIIGDGYKLFTIDLIDKKNKA